MSDFDRTKTVKTRKDHRCVWCGELIPKGSTVKFNSGRHLDSMYSQHWHDECIEPCKEHCKEGFGDGFDPHEHHRGSREIRYGDDLALPPEK